MSALESRPWSLLSLAGVVSVFVAVFVDGPPIPSPPTFAADTVPTPASFSALDAAETRIVSSDDPPSVHSATAVEIAGGRIRAFWYGGSREGASDVAIYTAVFDPSSSIWSQQQIATTREETARDLGRYVKKLGNPVAAVDGKGRLWLFYVSVSLGGWSGSAVNFRISEDEGESFGPARRVVTSPLLNVGTLVRGPAISFEDGTLGLPVYHELLGKFGELLRITPDGEVLQKIRLSHGRSSLQPVVIPLGKLDAVAFFRASGGSPKRVLSARTADGGRTWSPLEPTGLPNPDAGVGAVRTSEGALLLAYNDSETDRRNLKIAVSRDGGRTFAELSSVAPPEPSPSPELAYPWLLEASDGSLHLLYSWNRSRIVHVRYREP
ncbi:MAG TPA: sialidase family protein, partial [Vicinamibacteria bacterium]|nr:sialidase family protein [Vicinamibacteria bacterium]